MIHGDDKGLVLPPQIAPIQVVIVPIYFKENNIAINNKAIELCQELTAVGVRVHFDDRVNYKPGWKYNHWELKGGVKIASRTYTLHIINHLHINCSLRRTSPTRGRAQRC